MVVLASSNQLYIAQWRRTVVKLLSVSTFLHSSLPAPMDDQCLIRQSQLVPSSRKYNQDIVYHPRQFNRWEKNSISFCNVGSNRARVSHAFLIEPFKARVERVESQWEVHADETKHPLPRERKSFWEPPCPHWFILFKRVTSQQGRNCIALAVSQSHWQIFNDWTPGRQFIFMFTLEHREQGITSLIAKTRLPLWVSFCTFYTRKLGRWFPHFISLYWSQRPASGKCK